MKGIRRYVFFVNLLVSLTVYSRVVYGAEAFQSEISASYFGFEDDDKNERTGYSIDISQHFSPVNTAGHPLAEAAFLERIGGIGLFVTSSEFELQSFLGKTQGDGLSYGALVTVMRPNRPLFLRFFYSKSDDQFDTLFIGDTKRKRYLFEAGLFVKDGFLVNVEYNHVESDSSLIFLLGNAAFLLETTSEDKSYSIETKFVKKFRNESAINLQGRISINDFEINDFVNPTEKGTNTIGRISGDYYFNRMTSLGLSLTTNSGDEKDDEGETYGVNLLVFLNHHFSVAFSYDQFFADNASGVDDELTIIVISARF